MRVFQAKLLLSWVRGVRQNGKKKKKRKRKRQRAKTTKKESKSDSFEIDVMRDAHAIYLQDLKTSFKLQHVWEIVRNHPKWLAQFD